MIKEAISICNFRIQLTRYCRAVKLDKKQVTVTYNGMPFFCLKKLSENDNFPLVPLTVARDQMSNFIDLIEQNGAVILTAYNRKLVKCELI